MTTSDIAAALTSAALVGFVATLIIRDRLRECGVAQSLLVADMRAADIAADIIDRQKRTAELHEWQRKTRVEFEKALQGRPFLAAVRAEAEAAGLDDEWAAIQENGWAS